MTNVDNIKVWVEESAGLGAKAALPTLGTMAKNSVTKSVEISGETLRANVQIFVAQFATLIEDGTIEGTNIVIDEIELSLAVSASGGIELLGKMNAGAQASIKVKLKRK